MASKRETLINTISEWSSACTFHCYPKLFFPTQNQHVILKAIWTLLFVAFLGLTCWLFALAIVNYLRFETVSKIEIIQQNPMPFPAVTICDNNPFTTEQAQEEIQRIIDTLINSSSTIDKFMEFNLMKMKASSSNFTDEQRQALGFNVNLLVGPAFDSPINSSDLHYLYRYDYGNCFQFNTGFDMKNKAIPLLSSKLPGIGYGFSTEIGPLDSSANKFQASISNGLVLFVHDPKISPTYTDVPVYLKTGQETNIAIKQTLTKNIPAPYSQCVESPDSELAKILQNSGLGRAYRQKDCLELCNQQYIIEQCDCYFTAFPMLNNNLTRPCLNLTEFECLTDARYTFELDYSDSCRDNNCPLECEYTSYDYYSSSLSYPSRQYFNYLGYNFFNF